MNAYVRGESRQAIDANPDFKAVHVMPKKIHFEFSK